MREYYTIPNTAHRTVTYKGQTWTLAEDITYSIDPDYDAPVEPTAPAVSDKDVTVFWWFVDLEELEEWDPDNDLCDHINGVLVLDDD